MQSEVVTADLFPPTAGTQPALSAEQWLAGDDRHPILVSLVVSHCLVARMMTMMIIMMIVIVL